MYLFDIIALENTEATEKRIKINNEDNKDTEDTEKRIKINNEDTEDTEKRIKKREGRKERENKDENKIGKNITGQGFLTKWREKVNQKRKKIAIANHTHLAKQFILLKLGLTFTPEKADIVKSSWLIKPLPRCLLETKVHFSYLAEITTISARP